MARQCNSRRRGFSLIELVIVVVIIGIIAAIAIPRMSRGTAAAGDSALAGNLTVLRNAVELYTSEHAGKLPGTAADIADKLTKYSDDQGATVDTKDATHPYGPYLRKIPAVPVGTLKSNAAVNSKFVAGSTPEASNPTGGWLYDSATGNIKVNLPDGEVDLGGKIYNTY
jgi:prepilin-type N-terminal cleavage/methylation domain-containing protein